VGPAVETQPPAKEKDDHKDQEASYSEDEEEEHDEEEEEDEDENEEEDEEEEDDEEEEHDEDEEDDDGEDTPKVGPAVETQPTAKEEDDHKHQNAVRSEEKEGLRHQAEAMKEMEASHKAEEEGNSTPKVGPALETKPPAKEGDDKKDQETNLEEEDEDEDGEKDQHEDGEKDEIESCSLNGRQETWSCEQADYLQTKYEGTPYENQECKKYFQKNGDDCHPCRSSVSKPGKCEMAEEACSGCKGVDSLQDGLKAHGYPADPQPVEKPGFEEDGDGEEVDMMPPSREALR